MAKLFFSYAHEDEALRDELAKHLAVLQRQGHIEMWHDRRITAGQPLDRADPPRTGTGRRRAVSRQLRLP